MFKYIAAVHIPGNIYHLALITHDYNPKDDEANRDDTLPNSDIMIYINILL